MGSEVVGIKSLRREGRRLWLRFVGGFGFLVVRLDFGFWMDEWILYWESIVSFSLLFWFIYEEWLLVDELWVFIGIYLKCLRVLLLIYMFFKG